MPKSSVRLLMQVPEKFDKDPIIVDRVFPYGINNEIAQSDEQKDGGLSGSLRSFIGRGPGCSDIRSKIRFFTSGLCGRGISSIQ